MNRMSRTLHAARMAAFGALFGLVAALGMKAWRAGLRLGLVARTEPEDG